MNKKQWTKKEVLELLNKKESDTPKEIEIDDDNESINFVIKLPFKINFNQGHWKLFFKSEREAWEKFEKDESFFGTLGIFEKELNTFLENICSKTGIAIENINIEKEERMNEYDKQRNCHIIQNGVQVTVNICCKTNNEAMKVVSFLDKHKLEC